VTLEAKPQLTTEAVHIVLAIMKSCTV